MIIQMRFTVIYANTCKHHEDFLCKTNNRYTGIAAPVRFYMFVNVCAKTKALAQMWSQVTQFANW